MKHSTQDNKEKKIKQRNFLLVLPVIVLLFLTLLLWSVGLVGAGDVKAAVTAKGLNMQLPDARLKENKSWNKLSFYEQADKDSARYREAIKNDPYFHSYGKDSLPELPVKPATPLAPGYNPMPPGYEDPNEYKVNKKLAELNAALSKNNVDDKRASSYESAVQTPPNIQSGDIDRLERMLQVINQPDSGTDPETQQLNGMMDKILDMQHPERVKERIQQTSEKNKKAVFPVTTSNMDNYLSSLQQPHGVGKRNNRKDNIIVKQNTFYSLNNDTVREEKQNIIEAQIKETQTIINGATARLYLSNDVYVNGLLVPQGTFVYGTASQNGDRLQIIINSIHYQNNLLPVVLSVYDLDGIAGIYIPGSVSRDAAKQTGSEAVNNFGISSFDPSIGAQAANAGIAAAKSIIGKKVRQVKVTIKAGYKVLLKDDNQQQ